MRTKSTKSRVRRKKTPAHTDVTETRKMHTYLEVFGLDTVEADTAVSVGRGKVFARRRKRNVRDGAVGVPEHRVHRNVAQTFFIILEITQTYIFLHLTSLVNWWWVQKTTKPKQTDGFDEHERAVVAAGGQNVTVRAERQTLRHLACR